MSKLVDIEVTLVHETEKAYRIESHFTGETEWVAKSTCELDIKFSTREGVLTMPEYMAKEKGLI